MADRDRLLELFKSRAVAFGDFTLASGKKSSYYINSKKVLFQGEAIALHEPPAGFAWFPARSFALTVIVSVLVNSVLNGPSLPS